MTTVPIQPNPIFRALDDNGNPLAGGKLYSYTAGTNTPRATYADAGKMSANANPVVLDATGSAVVFLDNVLYKLVLKDAAGATKWSIDNVYGAAFVSPAMLPVVSAATAAAALAALGGIDAATLAAAVAAAATPAGLIMYWPGSVAPAGYLELAGQLVLRADHPNLWAAVAGGTFPIQAEPHTALGYFTTGDGSSTFRLPDYRGRFIRVWDNGAGIDPGRLPGIYQDSANRAHSHTPTLTDPTHSHTERVGQTNGAPYDGWNITGTTTLINLNATTVAAATGITVAIGTEGVSETTAGGGRPQNFAAMAVIKGG